MIEPPGCKRESAIENYKTRVLVGYNVTAIRATGQKFVRAQGMFAGFEAGEIFLIRAPWNTGYVEECMDFPVDGNKGHDDRVDASSQGYNHLYAKKHNAGAWGRNDAGLWLPQMRTGLLKNVGSVGSVDSVDAAGIFKSVGSRSSILWGRR